MQSDYNLIVLRLDGGSNFAHVIAENQRLNARGGSPLTTVWFKTQKFVRNELGEAFHPVLTAPTRLGIDLLEDLTASHLENPLFSRGEVLDLGGQVATNVHRASNLQACPYDRSTLAAMRDPEGGNEAWDDGLTDFTSQTYVELFYDVKRNVGLIYRATDMISGEQLKICLGEDVRGYGPIRLDLLPQEIRKSSSLVAVLPEFEF